MNKIIIIIAMVCIVLTAGCIQEEEQEPISYRSSDERLKLYESQGMTSQQAQHVAMLRSRFEQESIPVSTTPELDNLIQFLEEDKTDEIAYYNDPKRGRDYFVCCGFARELAKNASEYNITMGGVSLRDHEHVRAAKSYHAMNYVIIDNEFIIIEPQSDSIHYLDTIYYHWGNNYRYITIHPEVQIMSNYGKYKQTIDIDVMDYNETEIMKKWK